MWTGVGKLVLLHLLLMELSGHAKGKPLIGSEMRGGDLHRSSTASPGSGGRKSWGRCGQGGPLPSSKRLACQSGPSDY